VDFDWAEIDRELRELLGDAADAALDRQHLEWGAREIAAGRLSNDSNRLTSDPQPARREDATWLDALPAERATELEQVGAQALREGRVAAAVLNGGMATRFGGVVKGTVDVIDGRSFLDIKRASARRRSPAPFVVMNSFATHAATLRHLDERGLREDTLPFLQSMSLRLTPEGELYRGADGALSPYSPGHGDFVDSIRSSGTLERLHESGIDTLLLSNVDNLFADLDPRVIGFHLSHGKPVTVELAETLPGDVGGAPAWVGERLCVVEGFRFPTGFDFESLPFMNTNTFVFSTGVLERDYPLTWFYVEKRVDGRRAVQLERLVGELSSFVETAFLASPRTGADSRFSPWKPPADREALRTSPELRARL
jgi:UTP--glucose-1-phosphate uridylyltransferase